MKVNGVDISAYEAKQWNIAPGKRSIGNGSEMAEGIRVPVMLDPDFGLKEYTIKLNIHGEGRKKIWENASGVLKLFSGVAEAELDGFNDRFFTLSLKGADLAEYGDRKDRWGILTLTCTGYEHGYLMAATLSDELLFADGKSEVTYEAYTDSLHLNASQQESPKTTAPVPVNVHIAQVNVCRDNGEWFDGLKGKRYPMYANITIEGLCRNRAGKDLGPLGITVRPEMVHGEMQTAYPSRTGYGISEIRINGQTGQCGYTYNGAVPDAGAGGQASAGVDMAYPLLWGFPGQKIKVTIDTYLKEAYQPEYQVFFEHTPVYL